MEMMRGRKELVESVKKNKELLEEENRVLHIAEEKLTKKFNDENNKMVSYNNNLNEYNNLKKSEKKKAIINLLQITGIGLGVIIISNILNNDINLLSEIFNSFGAKMGLVFAIFGDSVILVDIINTLNSYKKENIDIFNIEEIEINRNKYFNDLQKTKSDISITNEALNTFDKRIYELTKNENNNNNYENLEEKPIQKKKI